jgi:acylphosphatase
MIHRLEAHIYGRVQMVMFRDFTTRKARKLGLVGQVRNLSDGSVHVVAEGDKLALDALVDKLHKGPVLAKVEHIDFAWKEPSGGYTSFDIAYE